MSYRYQHAFEKEPQLREATKENASELHGAGVTAGCVSSWKRGTSTGTRRRQERLKEGFTELISKYQ